MTCHGQTCSSPTPPPSSVSFARSSAYLWHQPHRLSGWLRLFIIFLWSTRGLRGEGGDETGRLASKLHQSAFIAEIYNFGDPWVSSLNWAVMERGKQDKRAARKFHLGFNPQPGLKLKSERQGEKTRIQNYPRTAVSWERELVSIQSQCLLSIIVRVYQGCMNVLAYNYVCACETQIRSKIMMCMDTYIQMYVWFCDCK